MNSPPDLNDDPNSVTIKQLMPELSNLAKKGGKVFAQLRNQPSLTNEMSRSLKEDDFCMVRTSKPSFTATNENMTVETIDNFSESRQKYESEIKSLKDTIKQANCREERLLERIEALEKENQKLHKQMKDLEIDKIKSNIMSEKYKDMDQFINRLFTYIDHIPDTA